MSARRAVREPLDGFYERALDRAERLELEEARRLEGIDDEVALLRLQLRRLLGDATVDERLLQGAVRLLIQALLAQRRLSGREADGIADAAAALIEQFADVLATSPGAGGDT